MRLVSHKVRQSTSAGPSGKAANTAARSCGASRVVQRPSRRVRCVRSAPPSRDQTPVRSRHRSADGRCASTSVSAKRLFPNARRPAQATGRGSAAIIEPSSALACARRSRYTSQANSLERTAVGLLPPHPACPADRGGGRVSATGFGADRPSGLLGRPHYRPRRTAASIFASVSADAPGDGVAASCSSSLILLVGGRRRHDPRRHFFQWLAGSAMPRSPSSLRPVRAAQPACACRRRGDRARARRRIGRAQRSAHIVGRDTASLDAAGVARAAIESLAESFCGRHCRASALDRRRRPARRCALQDDQYSRQHDRPSHAAILKSLARRQRSYDDVVNWPAARLAAGLIIVAASVQRGASARDAWRITMRDAGKHRSPNAGWPEAAMAGALHLQLAGPRDYDGVRQHDAAIGDGWHKPGPDDIRAALAVFRRATALLWLLLAIFAVLLV